MRRGRLETLHDFLEAVDQYHKPTRAIQVANLNNAMLKQLLEYSLRNGMMEAKDQGQRKLYYLTAWGRYIKDSLELVPAVK